MGRKRGFSHYPTYRPWLYWPMHAFIRLTAPIASVYLDQAFARALIRERKAEEGR